MSDETDNPGLVTPAQLRRWEKEYERLEDRINAMNKRRNSLRNLISAGKDLAPEEDEIELPPADAPEKKRRKSAKRGRRGAGSNTWTSTIKEIVLRANRPLPYSEVRIEIMKTKLSGRLQKSEKGFYGAISKLADSGEIERHKGHLFSPAAYAQFKADLAVGKVRDLKIPNIAHRSPMGEAIKAFLPTRWNGATSGEIIAELKKNTDFAAQIEKNKTHPYNVLARLVKNGGLIKKEDRYLQPENLGTSDRGAATVLPATGSLFN